MEKSIRLPKDLDNQLGQVKEIIEHEIKSSDLQLQEALIEMSQNGGKFLRPLLFLIFAQVGKTPRKNQKGINKIAASLEILHMATLIHDDVIDDSPLRRGMTSIQGRFGKDVAVYAGDLLFTIFFDLTLDEMAQTPYLKINATALKEILNGELGQMSARYEVNQPLSVYLDNAAKKTACLFKLACMEGAYFGGATDEQVNLASQIGENIGLSFQMLDDILDYTLDNPDANKPVLEDLATGVYSLPLLLALENDENDILKNILAKQADLTLQDFRQITQLVLRYKGVEKTRQLAQSYSQAALDQIEQLPQGQARMYLLKLTKHLLKRTM